MKRRQINVVCVAGMDRLVPQRVKVNKIQLLRVCLDKIYTLSNLETKIILIRMRSENYLTDVNYWPLYSCFLRFLQATLVNGNFRRLRSKLKSIPFCLVYYFQSQITRRSPRVLFSFFSALYQNYFQFPIYRKRNEMISRPP